MKIKRLLIVLAFVGIFTMGYSQNEETMKPYVIEVTTFKYKTTADVNAFWARDAEIEADYTSMQPGYISRESGYSPDNNEVVVVVRWRTDEDANASMNKFMSDASVEDYAAMIDGASMKMARYTVK